MQQPAQVLVKNDELKLFHTLIDNSHDMVFVLRANDGLIEFANKTAQNSLGYTLEEMQSLGIDGFRRSLKKNEPFSKHLGELLQKGAMTDYAVLTKKDGSEIPIEANVKIVEYGGLSYNIALVRDISERVRYEKKLADTNKWLENTLEEHTRALQENIARLQSYKTVLDANSIVSISDPSGKITYVNERFEEVSGYTKEEVVGQSHSMVRHPDTPKETFAKMWEVLKSKKIWLGQIENMKKGGGSYFIDSAIVPILGADGEIVEYIAARHEITGLIRQKEELEKAARTDMLTGLGNRLRLSEILSVVDSARLALIDLNGFHIINDFYGDKLGDRLIVQFSLLLQEIVAGKYEIFHLHGDEFAILCVLGDKEEFTINMRELNEKVSSKPIIIDAKTFPISTTTVLSFEAPTHLISTVSMARSFAKKVKEHFVIYSSENSLEKEYEENIRWTKKIKSAIEDDRIVVFYQPIVNTKTKEIYKHEALVRLIDDEGNVISPFFFLERSKISGQYIEITKIVVEKTLARMKDVGGKYSINLTIEDILNKSINSFLIEKLESCSGCENITFEVVESEGIANFEEVNSFIQLMKSYGCKFAIDDFGTGYSNFDYLLRLNTQYVKIDGSLIKQIDTNQDYYDIVKTIVEFANIKNLIVVAEFVSSEAIYKKVLELGIQLSQGYYFSEPINFELHL
jgi:PAS domain S-box-containing protein/diguanylate cyclase (GGDEF)-like protein